MPITVNGELHELTPPMLLSELVAQLGLAGRRMAIEVNGEVVPRSEFTTHKLNDHDRVEIVQAIGGG